MLIDHRHAVDNDAINRYYLTRVDHDHVIGFKPIHRDLNLGAVGVQPNTTRLLAKGIEEKPSSRSIPPRTSTRPKLRHQHNTVPGMTAIVPIQPTTTGELHPARLLPSLFFLQRELLSRGFLEGWGSRRVCERRDSSRCRQECRSRELRRRCQRNRDRA